MENTQRPVIYSVSSDIDDGILYAEFETEEQAIEYAKKHMDKLPFVDRLEVSYDANGNIDEVFEYTTVWDHTMVDGTKPESEEDYWDMLTQKYEDEEDGKHVIGDTTWFESVDSLVETLEENEDEVECKECFDLYPKADCIKLDFGYICPICAEAGSVSEDDIFKMDFPEYEKMSVDNDMIPAEPAISVESSEEISQEDPESEIDPISTPEDAVPFLVKDEEEAVAGYEMAAEVVEASDLENKEEILDTIEHIKEEEEEHIEELSELVEPTEGETPEDENDPISEDEVEEIEDPEAEPVEEAMSDSQRKLIDGLPTITKDEFQQKLESGSETIFTGDPGELGIRGRTYEVSYEDGKYVVSFWDETYNDDFTDSEVAEEFDTIDELWVYLIAFMEDADYSPEYNYLTEELTEDVAPTRYWMLFFDGNDVGVAEAASKDEAERYFEEYWSDEYHFDSTDHDWSVAEITKEEYNEYEKEHSLFGDIFEHVNQENPAIESDQELAGTDNAVVDCKVADVVTHSEDEKPVDCEGKKKPLTEATTAEMREIFKLCKEIGIDTGAELTRFAEEEVREGESLLDRLKSYRAELGDDFKIEENLTEAKRDPFHEAIFEAIDYLTEFSEIFPVPGNIGAANWAELKDDINYGLSSDFEIAEIIMEYFQKDLAIGEKHPEIFEDDPQSELTLETYNRLKRAYDRAVAAYEAAHPEDFEEQLDVTHGSNHIKSVATLVHKAVENVTKDNRVGTRPDGMSFYVLSDKRSADPEEIKKVILDALAAEGYEPDEVQFVDKGQVYGYVIGKLKMVARVTMPYQRKESLTEKFTPEEMAEYNMDEDGNSLDSYDTYVKCTWCEGIFTESECGFDYHMGWLCDRCQSAITSRGEKLMLITNPTDEDFARVLGEGVENKDTEPVTESVKANGAHESIVLFAKEIDAHFNKKYEIEILDGYKIHLVGEKTDLTSEINSVKNIGANNLEADTAKLSDGTYVYMLKPKATVAAESLTEDADEDEIEPISVDPTEKPSKHVKMANTSGTAGMDFEAACQQFGIKLDN